MWPWGHLAFAYLLHSSVVHLWYRRRPAWPGVALVALGSQMPDLIDKPLAWTLNILPSGRSLGHSVLVGTLIIVAAVALCRRYDLRGWPFALGYYSHLLGDSIRPLIDGRFHDLAFLLWPLFEVETGSGPSIGIVQYLLNAQLEGTVLVDLGLASAVFVWWLLDGAPGVRDLWSTIHARFLRPTE